MSSATSFWLATTAIVALIAWYILLLGKLKTTNESPVFSNFSKLLREPNENLHASRRREQMLERIKEERIKEYLDNKERR